MNKREHNLEEDLHAVHHFSLCSCNKLWSDLTDHVV